MTTIPAVGGDFTPQNRESAIALTLMFALSEFDGAREPFRLRHKITQKQIETAQMVIDWGFAIPVSYSQVQEMCMYMRFKRHKFKDWAPLMYHPHEKQNNRHGSCPICGTYAQLCQLPISFAQEHNWENRDQERYKAFGLCVVDRILNFTLNGFFQFDWPTGWVLLDRRVKNFYEQWAEVTPFPADADDE